MATKGWISVHRKIQEHWVWDNDEPFDKRSAWIDILLMVNHKDKKFLLGNELVEVKAGERITSERKLAKKWNWSRTKVRSFLELLEKDGMIKTIKVPQKRTRLKVLNYSDYQGYENQRKTSKKPVKNQSETSKEPQKNLNNNDNNDNNDNKPSEKSDTESDEFSLNKKDNGRYDYPKDYERLYSLYPYSRGNKKAGWRKWAATRRKGVEQDDLIEAAKNYAANCKKEGTEEKWVMHIKTFLGRDEHWKEYLGGQDYGGEHKESGGEEEKGSKSKEEFAAMFN